MKSAIERLYHSITEVSKILGEEQHVLRYWEREFSQLKPQKNRAGNRVYTAKDLAVLRVIKRLLRDERYTVAGAKEFLKNHGVEDLERLAAESEVEPMIQQQQPTDMREAVRKTARELRDIAQELRKRASKS